MTYSDAILAALARSRRSGREVSIAAVGHESAIRSIKRGMDVRVSTLMALCEELGLEFYVGPRRLDGPVRDGYTTSIRESEPPPPWVTHLLDEVRSEIRQLRAPGPETSRGEPAAAEDERFAGDVVWSREPRAIPGARFVDCYEVRLAAPPDALLGDSTRVGCLGFRRSWLERHGLDASQCAVMRVPGDSMDPTLNAGSTILVNLAQRRRLLGRVFAVRTDAGLVVGRAGKDAAGRWQLVCDHPGRAPRPWPDGAEVLGQVRWGSRTFT